MANDTEIGSISVGISADTSQLKSAFEQAKAYARDFKVPEKVVPIRLSIREPTEADIRKAQTAVTSAMRKAATLKVEIAPSITVQGAKIAEFRAGIAAAMAKTQDIPVGIVADVDATAIQNQIKSAIGVIDVPLRWFWENGPPPAGGTPGGGAGPGRPPGSPGPTPGAPNPPPPGRGPVYTRPTVTTQTGGVKCPICGIGVANAARLPDHINYKHGATSAPATPVAGQTAAPVAGPTPPPGGGATPTFTSTPAPTSEAEMRRNRFSWIRNQLERGRAGGMTELMKSGARVNLGEGGSAITAKRGSDLAKFLKESVDPESALGFLEEAIASYATAITKEAKSPSDLSGAARSMAGATPVRSASATNKLRAEIEAMAKERAKEYRNRPDVKAMREEFAEKGFAAFAGQGEIGTGLVDVHNMISQDPTKAREMLVGLLSKFFAAVPKQAKALFSQDPGKGKTGGAGPRTKQPRKIARGTDDLVPGAEAAGAAISALFSELFRVSLPQRDEQQKAAAQTLADIRTSRRLRKNEAGELVEVPNAPTVAFGETGEGRRAAEPGEVAAIERIIRSAPKPKRSRYGEIEDPARAGGDLQTMGGAGAAFRLRQTAEQIMEERRVGRASSNSRINTAGVRVPGRGAGGMVGGKRAYLVGERGPEVFVPDENGEIVPNNRLEKRAAGGPVQSSGFLAQAGRFISTAAAAAEASFAKSGLGIQGGGVQRVWVVNMPAGGGGFAAGAGGTSAPGMGTAGGGFTAANLGTLGQAVGQALGQAQAASGGGGGGGGGGGSRSQKFSALQEAQLQAQRDDLITAQRLRQRGLAAALSASIREAPTRGVSTATGEIASINLGGLRGVIERRRLADEAATRTTVATNRWATAVERLERRTLQLSAATKPKDIADYTLKVKEAEQAVDFTAKRMHTLGAESEELSKRVISGSDKMKIFAANTAGVVGGMIIFSTLLGAAQAAITGIGEVVGPVVERFSGWANVSAKVTDNLAEQTRQSGGAIQTTLALTAAQTGLSDATYENVSAAIEQRVQGQAGNKAFQAQLELLHTAQAMQRQGGIGGFDRSLVETTGGLNVAGIQTPIGGTPSFFEQFNNELRQFSATTGKAAPNQQDELIKSAINSTPVFGDINRLLNSGGGGIGPAQPDNPQARAADQAFVLNTMRDVGDAAKRAGGELNFVAASSAELKQQQAQQVDQLTQSSIPAFRDLATTLEHGNIVIPKTFASLEELQTYLLQGAKAAQTGAGMPDPAVLMKTMTERLIPNQLAAFNEEARLQLQTFIPAQRGLESLAQPQLPYGTGLTQQPGGLGPAPTTGFGQGALDPMAKQSFNEYKAVATAALDAVAAKAREGKAALAGLGVPASLIGELETLGEQAKGIEIGVANRSAAFEAAQYNRQLFIMKRNLADAEALLGRQVGSQGRLGQLERENFELGKRQQSLQIQAQTLSLQLTQRQINFQRAVAGFQAPGLTPEERRANVAQAKIEADFAQRQLNIQKQLLGLGKRQFAVSVDIFGETAKRQVQDLRSALAELQQGRALQLDTKAANEALRAIRAREAQIAQDIGVYIDKAQKKAAAAIGSALDIANKSGAAFGTILVQTARAWGQFVAQGANAIHQLTGGGPPPRNNNPRGGGGSIPQASGFLGSVSGATSMIVGEAGMETVAVLRNPRVGSMGGIGGGAGVTINFNGDFHVRSDADIDTLVSKVVSAMGRQASLKGLRSIG